MRTMINGKTPVAYPTNFVGTVTNAVPSGKGGLFFDGAGDFITIPDSDDTKYIGPVTICVWAFINSGSAYRCFACKQGINDAENNVFEFRTENSPVPKLSLARAGPGSPTKYRAYKGQDVQINQWNHCAVRFSGDITNPPTFFYNGSGSLGVLEFGVGSGLPSGGGHDISIGMRPNGVAIMHGSMHDLRIFSRELSSAEIAEIMKLDAAGLH